METTVYYDENEYTVIISDEALKEARFCVLLDRIGLEPYYELKGQAYRKLMKWANEQALLDEIDFDEAMEFIHDDLVEAVKNGEYSI